MALAGIFVAQFLGRCPRLVWGAPLALGGGKKRKAGKRKRGFNAKAQRSQRKGGEFKP